MEKRNGTPREATEGWQTREKPSNSLQHIGIVARYLAKTLGTEHATA
jgi:hypothetical protein